MTANLSDLAVWMREQGLDAHRDDVTSCILDVMADNEALRKRVAPQWQPIETAEKIEKDWLWLWVPGHGIVTAMWTEMYGGVWISQRHRMVKSATHWQRIQPPESTE